MSQAWKNAICIISGSFLREEYDLTFILYCSVFLFFAAYLNFYAPFANKIIKTTA